MSFWQAFWWMLKFYVLFFVLLAAFIGLVALVVR